MCGIGDHVLDERIECLAVIRKMFNDFDFRFAAIEVEFAVLLGSVERCIFKCGFGFLEGPSGGISIGS